MDMSKRIITFFICATIASAAIANESKDMLFSYQKVLDAQFSCNSQKFSELKIDPSLGVTLATKAWSVVSDVKLKELNNLKIRKDMKSFRMSFDGLGYLECGEEVKGLNSFCGEKMVFSPFIQKSKTPSFFYVLTGVGTDENVYREGWSNYTSNEISSDMPSEPGTRGFTCLIDLKDLIKNPKAINLDQLCEGRSKEDRIKTEKEIQKAIAIWTKRKCTE